MTEDVRICVGVHHEPGCAHHVTVVPPLGQRITGAQMMGFQVTVDGPPVASFAETWRARAAQVEEMRRDPGYATENVVPVNADEALYAWLGAIVWATQADHEHNAYGWKGCSLCRRIAAENTSARFPDDRYRAVAERPERETI